MSGVYEYVSGEGNIKGVGVMLGVLFFLSLLPSISLTVIDDEADLDFDTSFSVKIRKRGGGVTKQFLITRKITRH